MPAPPADVYLRFPGPDGAPEPLHFGPPDRVLQAISPDDVRATIRAAEAAARAGQWAVGCIAYEAAGAFDPAATTHAPAGNPPCAWFALYTDPPQRDAVATAPAAPAGGLPHPDSWESDTPPAVYRATVADLRAGIAAGDVYQVNYTFRLATPITADLDERALYHQLAGGGHGDYFALLRTGAWTVLSISPELFFDVRDGVITSRPMKGTMPRGRWTEEDAAHARALHASAKDRAENLMIVDLMRNDIGRIARFGSVTVPDLYRVERYATVHQMTSTVRAQLRADLALDDIFAALFPCGSITGAPKLAAMQAIRDREAGPRGAYCGAIGVLRPDGSATFNVAIRTLHIDRLTGTATYGVGGGITWDSAPAAEYDEARSKAAILARTTPDFALLETMRLDDGEIARRGHHLDRIADSARYWEFPADARDRAASALASAAADARCGHWRLRLQLPRHGPAILDRTPLEAEPFAATPTTLAATRPVAFARGHVDSRDPMLQHKTTARDRYDAARDGMRRHAPDCFDALLVNEHDGVTEFTTGNVVAEFDGALVTPPRADGLLPGTFRRQLLADGMIGERTIGRDEIRAAGRLWLINSVRGWLPVALREG